MQLQEGEFGGVGLGFRSFWYSEYWNEKMGFLIQKVYMGLEESGRLS